MEQEIISIIDESTGSISTNYTTGMIWDRRPYLSSLANYAENDRPYAQVVSVDNTSSSTIIQNNGPNSEFWEAKTGSIEYIDKKMARRKPMITVTNHDIEELQRNFRTWRTSSTQDIYDQVTQWQLGYYERAVRDYCLQCDYALGQLLSNPTGWTVPNAVNQEALSYNPNLTSSTGTLADFNTTNPETVLLDNVIQPLLSKGYRPNVIFVGEAVKDAILNSTYYNTKNNTPSLSVIESASSESSNIYTRNGALVISGLYPAGCKVVYINSIINSTMPSFNANAAVAVNTNNFASIWNAPTHNFVTGVDSSIISWVRDTSTNPYVLRFFAEHIYLPTLNNPSQINQVIYS